MKNVGVLLVWNLLVLSATGDLEVTKNSTSFRTSGEICLNGGVSVSSLTGGRHMFCLCADGFEGKLCETAKAQDCYVGVGHFYRGTVSKSWRGRMCEEWDAETRQRYLTSDVNAGRHNYCRNPNFRRRPWCYVRRNLKLVAEYCDVPRCTLKPTPPSPAATETQIAELSCGLPTRRMQYKIVGGETTAVEAHPWYAAVLRQKHGRLGLHCGGSLISPCWVLTAAHCIPDGSKTNMSAFSIILGRNRLHEENPAVEQQFSVEQIFVHEGYGKYLEFDDDIALMKLKAKDGQCAKRSNFVNTICLPPPQQFVPAGTLCEIVGFGDEKEGAAVNPEHLKEAQVNIFPDDMCAGPGFYGKRISEKMFCAGRLDWSRDSCQGDSGGPLACEVGSRFFQFGIVSWGDGCARSLRPGVYTKVSKYNQWIEEKTGLITSGVLYPEK